MKQPMFIVLAAALFISSAFLLEKPFVSPFSAHNRVENLSFATGEVLDYNINFGFLKAGEGKMVIQEEMYQVKGTPCYKIDFFGKTTGAAAWIADVDNNWGAYVDAVELKPHLTYRNIQEGKYRKREVAEFDYPQHLIHYKELDFETGEVKENEKIKATGQIFDMICGMAYLRNYDFDALHQGDTISFKAFLEDTLYDFNIVYHGKEKVKTKVGKFRAHVLKPIMPENKLFSGTQPITVWFSDDENQIPVRIDADFAVGNGKCILTDYKNLKSKPNLVN